VLVETHEGLLGAGFIRRGGAVVKSGGLRRSDLTFASQDAREAVYAAQFGVTAFWAWWFLVRANPSRSWQTRPAFAVADGPVVSSGSRLWDPLVSLISSVVPTAHGIARR
jgi:hypothetical protein